MFNLKKKNTSNIEKFNRIINFAKEIIDSDPEYSGKHPIIDVIRLLGRKVQTDYLMNLLYCEDESHTGSLYYPSLFIDEEEKITKNGLELRELLKEVDSVRKIYLKHDLVFPWPWKRSRLINCLIQIGEGRELGVWEEDVRNHFVELWLPIGIVWVSGGNHSISTGIIQGEGVIKPEITHDISPLYEHIYSDGINYYTKFDNKPICQVKDVEFAAIFEIGRLMVERNISF
jgi:hypothetical protein